MVRKEYAQQINRLRRRRAHRREERLRMRYPEGSLDNLDSKAEGAGGAPQAGEDLESWMKSIRDQVPAAAKLSVLVQSKREREYQVSFKLVLPDGQTLSSEARAAHLAEAVSLAGLGISGHLGAGHRDDSLFKAS